MTDAPRWWVDGVRAALEYSIAAPAATALVESFVRRIPSGYVERTDPAVAAADIVELESLAAIGAPGERAEVRMAVQPDPDPGAGMFRLRLYGRRAMELSSFLPTLESFGLTVVEAVPHHIAGPDGTHALHLDDFGLRARGRAAFDPATDGNRLLAAIQAAWRGESEVDSLNRLVVRAGIDWSDVVVLRAYRRYRRQVGSPWSDRQLDDPLVEFPDVARALLRYYAARFDPTLVSAGALVAEAARDAVLQSLASVERLEQDQVLRAYLALIDATLRSSHYVRTTASKAGGGAHLPTLTMKFACARTPELPPPRPHVEAFVYSPRVEGLHLRGGRVARGGIRWSDRQDDLRTEVLGLVRSQVLKNAGIVPTGAKGGFVCKRLARPDGEEVDVVSEVRECYRLFVSGLLDITDNVVGGEVATPSGVCPADGEDTYLVVAADRGTAALSDLANEISAAHHFWLGDAFASGGRHGYDHKAMGITARGAWVIARQHFRQLGIDPETEEIRVIGVGDMSGDVFGNGMLRSRTIKLIAAFDHRHIFVDPDPDPARSYAARAELFTTPGSSWQDYDHAAISPGGGVWSRRTKEIALSPEARLALGMTAAVLSPPELISAILTAATDLLWFGGIGTFVKAPSESHTDVGDRTNDAVRVDADRVRARVVVEGGNLGFTQLARIGYSRRGGKINADFVDNAGGVATSDYEVNLKILLALAIESGQISSSERDEVLHAVQEDVAEAVLRDVGLTALAVTRAVPASAADLDAFEALMARLEVAGRLDRKVEALPTGEDLAVRRAAGAGLTRPEAAVVLAMAKSDLSQALAGSSRGPNLTIDDGVAAAYFPTLVAHRFADLIPAHRLNHQLAATRMASEIVDRMGVTWAHETAEEFGVAVADVGRAYWAARYVLGAEPRWRQVDALAATISADAEADLYDTVAAAADRLARRYLRDGAADLAGDRLVAEQLGAIHPGIEQAARAADVGVAVRAGASLGAAVDAFDAVDTALGLTSFRSALARLPVGSRWGRWQVRRLGDDIADLRRQAVLSALAPPASAGAMTRWLVPRAAAKARFLNLAARLGDPEGDGHSLAALAVRALSDLIAPPRS